MSLRESLAVSTAPIFLRLALGVTFMWAGMAKVFHWVEVSGQDAATLANYGIIQPAQLPAMEPIAFWTAEDDASPAAQDELEDPQEAAPAAPPAAPRERYTPGQFPEPVKVRALHRITLMLDGAMKPWISDDGQQKSFPLWIDFDSTQAYDPYPVYAAWGVGLTELVGGGLLLLGLLTRLSALGIAGTMVGALWLTQIGPAMQSGQTVLGFLPDRDFFDLAAWSTGLWQFSLLLSSLALFCTGSGTISIDRLLFGNPFFYKAPAAPKKKEE